jgi:secreted PhoX family phosphatase
MLAIPPLAFWSFAMSFRLPRRQFLFRTAAAAGSFAVAGAFDAFRSRAAQGAARRSAGFGPLRPVADEATGLELLRLPEGFRYISFGWTGEPMADGAPTPPAHDGMAVIDEQNGILTLCRNHEVGKYGESDVNPAIRFDPQALGGCTNLRFDANAGRWLDARRSIAGTVRNCAGGPTPWGSWLTCEETVVGAGDEEGGTPNPLHEDHGWIFEVPAEGTADPVPLKDMGRFVHEAVAVDPNTGIVYETEDRGSAGFYRFLPNEPGHLRAGGRLQMLAAKGERDLRRGSAVGQRYDVSWVAIDDPYRPHSPGTKDELGVFQQGREQGGSMFSRLEGCWWGNGGVYLVSTNGGRARRGQVWFYEPEQEQLTLIYESPSAEVLNMPDNMTVSPRGGIVLCEDGSGSEQRLHGLTRDGQLFELASNNVELPGEGHKGFKGNYRGQEWAGATFSPDGRWMFANIQTPGITFAITGPWEEGGL